MTQASFANLDGREGQDMALLCASFDQDVELVFMQDAVYQLVGQQRPEQIGCKDYLARLKGLALYDIEQVYVCQSSLENRGLKKDQLCLNQLNLVDTKQLQHILEQADHIMVY